MVREKPSLGDGGGGGLQLSDNRCMPSAGYCRDCLGNHQAGQVLGADVYRLSAPETAAWMIIGWLMLRLS